MNFSLLQIKIVITLLQHFIQCEENRIKILEEELGKEIFELNSLGRNSKDDSEQKEFWLQADKKDSFLNSEIENWTYQRFYLRQFLEYLQKKLRQAKNGGSHADAA